MNIVAFRSHKLKRKVRSTLAAETAAMNEAIEQGDLVRAHLIEFFGDAPLDKRNWRDEVKRIPLVDLTDSKSLYDYVKKQGSIPDNKRLLLDLEIIRDQVRDDGVELRWVDTKHQLADAMTKDATSAADYLHLVLKTGEVSILEDAQLQAKLDKHKTEVKHRRKERWQSRRGAATTRREPDLHDANGAPEIPVPIMPITAPTSIQPETITADKPDDIADEGGSRKKIRRHDTERTDPPVPAPPPPTGSAAVDIPVPDDAAGLAAAAAT